MKVRDVDHNIVRRCVVNAKLHVCLGPGTKERTIVPVLGGEMLENDTRGMIEVLLRLMPYMSRRWLTIASEASEIFILVEIGDACKVNLKQIKVQAAMQIPNFHQWVHTCDSHQCNLIQMRPLDLQDMVTGLYCWSKLTRVKA